VNGISITIANTNEAIPYARDTTEASLSEEGASEQDDLHNEVMIALLDLLSKGRSRTPDESPNNEEDSRIDYHSINCAEFFSATAKILVHQKLLMPRRINSSGYIHLVWYSGSYFLVETFHHLSYWLCLLKMEVA
jgi:hypothetical protein